LAVAAVLLVRLLFVRLLAVRVPVLALLGAIALRARSGVAVVRSVAEAAAVVWRIVLVARVVS
jgi:hypothetical protein